MNAWSLVCLYGALAALAIGIGLDGWRAAR